ncbi:MAG: gamma-glutamyltransferase [Gemmatimonadota bacterium]|nr:gamma-glutamyltransferase [Gemmatimonadota bacterium]
MQSGMRTVVAVSLVVAACGPFPGAWPLDARRGAAAGREAMVVTASPLASAVGRDILRAGGNAVDAAVAVGFALAVVHPSAGNIGGGGFLLVRLPSGETAALDYRETAPGGATPDMYRDSTGAVTDAGVVGHRAAGVPGSVAGLAEAHRRYGRLPFARLVAPAVALARDGFVLDEARADGLRAAADRLAQFPASARQFLPGGEPPDAGSRLVQPDLARTLEAIADSGARVFYAGSIAERIVAEMARGGGLITRADLAQYEPHWREPVQFTYRAYTVLSMPPSSSGGVTLAEILNMLEGPEPLPPFGSADHVHRLTEVMRRAFADRNHYLGDPAFVTMPVATLVSQAYADARRADIAPGRATPSIEIGSGRAEGMHTTHYAVVDGEGMAVSATTTINSGFGSGVTVTGAGFLLNNEMDDFTSAPGQPNQFGLVQGEANAIRPGKRMLSAMTPTLVLDPAGRLFLLLGSPGGPTIITTVAQVISNVIDYGMTLPQAVAAPRVHHQHLPDTLRWEHRGLRASTVRRLTAMGHALAERRDYSGEVAAIMRTDRGWLGVPDPRMYGGAAGY